MKQAHSLISALEDLADTQESRVREKATTALREVAGQMSHEQLKKHFHSLVHRLASHDWSVRNLCVCVRLSMSAMRSSV